MNTIISLIIACIIALGAPVQPASQPPQPASQPASVTCEEDMPCWDSATMGQDLPRLTDSELEAWERVSALGIVAPSNEWALEYVETITYTPTSYPVGYFALNSSANQDASHVMHWVHIDRT